MREEWLFSPVQVQGLETMNAPKRIAEEIREGIGARQPEHRSVLRTDEVSRREKELSAQPPQGSLLKTRWCTQSLERREEIVGQQHELEEGLGAAEVLHGDLVERIGGFEFADNELGPRSIIVESPHREREPAQMGDEHLIRIPLHLEEMELCGGLLGHRATDDNKPRRTLPALWAIAELGGPEIPSDVPIAQCHSAGA